MTGLFKKKNPGNVVVLLLYALALHLPHLLNPMPAVRLAGDHLLYRALIDFLDPLARVFPSIYPLLAFILLFTQASLLNRICNNLRLFPKPHFLTAMAYILLCSLVKDWHVFSAPLILNTFLIWVWYSMLGWYNSTKAKSSMYNTGLVLGLMPLLYSPAISFIILFLFALIVMRPFRITEWVVGFLGLLTPAYFALVGLFLTDRLGQTAWLPGLQMGIPHIPSTLWFTGALMVMLIPFMAGGYYVQDQLNKMLIQVRKGWSMLLLMLLVSIFFLFLNPKAGFEPWIVMTVPLAVFHAAAYYFPQGRVVPLILHWLIFSYAIWQQYGLSFAL